MKECKNCTHCHDYGHKIMCDLGIGEVIVIGPVIGAMSVEQCHAYDEIKEEKRKPGRPKNA